MRTALLSLARDASTLVKSGKRARHTLCNIQHGRPGEEQSRKQQKFGDVLTGRKVNLFKLENFVDVAADRDARYLLPARSVVDV